MSPKIQRAARSWLLPITLLVVSPLLLKTAWAEWRKNKYMAYEPDPDNKLTLLPPFEHKEPEDDDMGLPENPILSNYAKYLWTSHERSGGIQKDNNAREVHEEQRRSG